MNSHLNRLFFKAYILGGSPCSGKSTIAEMLAAQYGYQYYRADDHDPAHMQRSHPDRQPVMFRISKMSWDEIWSRPPSVLLEEELAYYRESFPFILEDLYQLELEKPVILEGAAFLPALISQFPLNGSHVIYMVPTIDFQLHHYRQRPWIRSILNDCRDPKQAFDNWMKRDELFGQEVIRQANAHGFQIVLVDGSLDIPTQFQAIRNRFGLREN